MATKEQWRDVACRLSTNLITLLEARGKESLTTMFVSAEIVNLVKKTYDLAKEDELTEECERLAKEICNERD